MARQTKRPPVDRRKPLNAVCPYCEAKTTPNYKNWEELTKLTSERNKILNRSRSGVCAKHQKILAREIKRARHLALLPFSGKLS